MKKLLPLLTLLFCLTNLKSQDKYMSKKINFDSNILRANQQKTASALKTSSFNSGWFNYGAMVAGSLCYYTGAYLFPDTTASVYTSGSTYPVSAHHIAEVVDFKSPVFGSAWITSAPTSARLIVDSLSIGYGYTRSHTNITDTLIITVFEDISSTNSPYLDNYFLNTINIPGGSDTIFYKKLGYNQVENKLAVASNTTIAPTGQMVFKILLNQSDSSINGKEKVFALPKPFISNGNKLICASFQFKPGYSYTLGETINLTANAFQFISMEEEGPYSVQGTFMNYWDYLNCRNPLNVYCDRGSSSQIVTKDIRYNNAGLWNGSFRPAITFPQNYRLEHHSISFHLTDDTTNVCESTSHFSVISDTMNPGVYKGYNNCTGIGNFSYLWDFGDGTTSTLQYPSHQYSVPGQYVICLTLSTTSGTVTCTDTYCDSSSVQKMAAGFLMSQFNVIAPIVTSINETEKTIDIKTYPNPISDELIIEFTNKDFEKLNYVLTDALGRTVFSNNFEKDKTTINTSQLSKGFYNLNIINTGGNKIKTLKIIK